MSQTLQQVKPKDGPEAKVQLNIGGMTCASCALRIEKGLGKLEGIHAASVNLALEKATVAYDPSVQSLQDIMTTIASIGYEVRQEQVRLQVTGMDNSVATQQIEAILKQEPSVFKIETNLAIEEITIGYNAAQTDPTSLIGLLKAHGFTAHPRKAGLDARQKEMLQERKRLLFSSLLTIPILIDMFYPLPMTFILLLATLVQFGPGFPFYKRAYLNLRHKNANMDVLVALGTSVAYFYSVFRLFTLGPPYFFDTSALVLTFIIAGKYLEAKAKHETTGALNRLSHLQPATVTKINGTKDEKIPLEEVAVGDSLRIFPGERIPVDGIIHQGRTTMDESALTGESVPKTKSMGDRVQAGTLNKEGHIVILAQAVGRDTALAQMIALVEEAQSSRAPIQRLADQISNYFVPAVILLSVVTLVAWYALTHDWTTSLLAMTAVLVVACPCSLGLATPTAIMVASGEGAKLGILYRSAPFLEKAASLDLLVFDKTGTITQGRMDLIGIESLTDASYADLLHLAAVIEKGSEHPLAKAVIGKALEKDIDFEDPEDFYADPGRGVWALIENEEYTLGKQEFIGIHDTSTQARIESLESEGKTVTVMARAGKPIALLIFADQLREEAQEVMQSLQNMGYRLAMLTGDSPRTAQSIAVSAGIEEVKAGVLPHEKAAYIQQLKDKGLVVAMIGDGINDAAALATADIGIAMGSGTDIAIESADLILMRGNLHELENALILSRKTIAKIKQNLSISFIYNTLAIPFAAFGILPPMIAGGLMALSSVSVVTNSLTLRRLRWERG